jgi:hypothetical protein
MSENKKLWYVEDLFTTKDGESGELIEELKNSIKGNTIHHRFVVDTYTRIPEHNNVLNKKYKRNKEKAEKALKNRDYRNYLNSHEKPYKLAPLIVIFNMADVDDKLKAELLVDAWTSAEGPSVCRKHWVKLFKYFKKRKELLMTEEELEFFNNLPEEITIYRGAESIKGISWTLSKENAEWFAKRFEINGTVFEKTVKISDCFCYLNEREEQEIIYIDKA